MQEDRYFRIRKNPHPANLSDVEQAASAQETRRYKGRKECARAWCATAVSLVFTHSNGKPV